MKKWLDQYQLKGEVKYNVPTGDNLQYKKPIVFNNEFIKEKRNGVIKEKRNSINLPNQIFASNTRDKILADRRKHYFPYEIQQTKNIRDLADEQVFQSSGDLISALHPIGVVINALYQGADKTLPAEAIEYLPNKIPFKQARGYNRLIPILKPVSKLIDPIQMFDKLRIADSLYNSADSIDLYNQFKNGGLVSKNSLNRKVTCSNCGWSWKLSDGGLDPMTCHKCGGDIKMQNGGEPLDEYQYKGEYKGQVPVSDVMQNRVPIGIQQIPIDPFTHQPLTREQIQMQRFVPYSNKPQPIISQGTWSGNRKTKDVNYDPYSRIIEKDPQSEANIGKRMRKELITKKVPAGVTAAAAIMAAPLAAPIVSSAMSAPLTIGATTVPWVTPTTVIGAGFGLSGANKLNNDLASNYYTNPNISKFEKGIRGFETGLDLLGTPGVVEAIGTHLIAPAYRGALGAGEYLTTQTPLKNTYKINPLALKENPEMFLYRARPVGQDVNMNMAAQLRAKQAAGEPLTWYQKNLLNPQTNPQLLAREKYYGKWFEKDPSRLDFYINPGTRNFADDEAIEILRTRLPKAEAAKLNVSQFPDAKVLSASPETEFILPKNMISSAEKFPESSWQELIQQDKAFNTPHWLKGYGKKSNLKVFTEGQPYEGAPHIYQDMYPINGRYQPRTVITDAGVKNEILGLEPTPVVPTNAIEYPVTPNKFLNQTYDDFGRMEEGLVGNTTPSTQESIWNNILKNSYKNKKLPGSKTSYSIVRDSEGKIQFLDNETYRDALVTGKSNIVNYLSDPRYKAVVERNQELANRLNMNRVLPIQKEMGNAGLHDARVAKINQPITILDPRSLETKIIQGTNEGVQAQYSRNLDGSGFLTIPRVYDKTKTIRNVEHEALHHIYPNLGEGLPSFTPLEARKAKAVFKDNTALRKIEEENNIPFWYLDDVDELVPNSFDLANDLGIAKFQKYPGVESFKKMLESYTGGKKFIKDALKLDTPRDYKRAWDMLSGVRLGIVPAIGVGAALNQKQQGGPIVTNRGQWDYPGQTTIIPSNQITMQGVPYPVVGVDNTGHTKMMQPGMDYTFPGQYVTEYPMAQNGYQVPITNNLFNRTFRDKQLIKQEILDENPALQQVMTLDNMNINYARRNQRRLLEKLHHNPEYFDKDNNQNGILDNQNDTDDGYPYSGNIYTSEGVIKNPNPGEFTTLINKRGMNRQQIKDAAANDFISHSLHYSPQYQDYSNKLNQMLLTKHPAKMIEENGGVDAYMRSIFTEDPSYFPYKEEMSFIDPNFINEIKSYVKGISKKEQGGEMIKRADGSYSRRGLWDNIRANRGSGKEPTKEMLEQERKIRSKYEQGGVVLNAGGEKHRIYVKSTNRGEGAKGHIMVNHPTMDKGMWDTIDLTEKAGATTIAQGVAATKKWHRENPYMKQKGGEQSKFNPLLINKKIWSEPNYVVGPNAEGHYGYNGYDTINYNPNDEIENINNPWWLGHEKYHHYQTLSGNNPKERRQKELNDKLNQMIKKTPELQFVPEEILIRGIHQDDHHIPGAEDLMYEDPNTLEGAARLYENYIREGRDPIFANGGYVVRRSHDRKGKTHVVIGPDGTKKYFGDPNMGERGKSKYGKEAFYARHKSNLAKNPYFRAYARATWEEGGETYAIGGQSTLNPIVKKDNRNWLDYLKN